MPEFHAITLRGRVLSDIQVADLKIRVAAKNETKTHIAKDMNISRETMYKYLRGKLENSYPSYEKEAEIQGKVYVRFVVEKDGSITNADVVRKVSPGLDKLARTTVEGMPKWTPGKQGGKPVRMWFTLPVSFQLQ